MRYQQTLFLIIVLIHSVNFAQSSYEYGILPSLNINKKLPKDWSLNFKTESRQSLVKENFQYDYLLTDFSFITAKKVDFYTKIVIGYLMRVDDEGIKNRAVQQINIIKPYLNFRLAHRISTDQTFQKNNRTKLRLRYRVSAEIPISGQSADPKEFFLKFGNEILNSLQGEDYDLEIRGAGFIGYVISPKNKIEFGLDYRLDSFIDDNPRNRFLIGLNFYQSI